MCRLKNKLHSDGLLVLQKKWPEIINKNSVAQ